jgi:uncharacterized protein YodC (DUF2158 family)
VGAVAAAAFRHSRRISLSLIATTSMGVNIAEQIKKGDVVKLKSGGPKMTVTQVGERMGAPTVWTTWFDGTKAIEGAFPPEALEVA